MTTNLKLLCVFAHPDDESLGNGGMLARYAAEGIETSLVVATRGERGWSGNQEEYPGVEAFGRKREAEVLAAAQVLGLRQVLFLDYRDGELDQADPVEVIAKIVGGIRPLASADIHQRPPRASLLVSPSINIHRYPLLFAG